LGSQRDFAYSDAAPQPALGVSSPPTTTLGPHVGLSQEE
jgi:hypothetical protein